MLLIASRSSAGSVTVTVAGAVVTPLSVSRTPGIACSTTFESHSCCAPPSTRKAACRSSPVSARERRVLGDDGARATTSELGVLAGLARRQDEVLAVGGVLTTAATAGPSVLALMASAICCLVEPAAISIVRPGGRRLGVQEGERLGAVVLPWASSGGQVEAALGGGRRGGRPRSTGRRCRRRRASSHRDARRDPSSRRSASGPRSTVGARARARRP